MIFLSELHTFQINILISLTTIFRLASHGKQIIGWDDEWGVEWTQSTLKYGGAAAYQKLNRHHTKMPQKIVLWKVFSMQYHALTAQFFEIFLYGVISAFDKLLSHCSLTNSGSTSLQTHPPNQ